MKDAKFTIQNALISVYNKDNLEPIIRKLHELGIGLISTGGTSDYIRKLNIPLIEVENLTGFPSIFGGRVKTLHPSIFGGILYRRDNENDIEQARSSEISAIDLVIVDLYPFEKTLSETDDEATLIEKIDIGGISLIRAAAKNYAHVLVVPSVKYYDDLLHLLNENGKEICIEDSRIFASRAFAVSSNYDTAIFNWMNKQSQLTETRLSFNNTKELRYGENPHQKAWFCGDLGLQFEQLNGKELSYNNLQDVAGAVDLISEFADPACVIVKHTNACGAAIRQNPKEAWMAALAGDPISAFGGIIAFNRIIDSETAALVNELFFEVLFAPAYDKESLEILKSKKNRIILQQHETSRPNKQFRSLLGGVLIQETDQSQEDPKNWKAATHQQVAQEKVDDLIFANRIVKHLKSNAIVLVKDKQLIGAGIGQTSRVDAVRQAIEKAHTFGFDTTNSVMASDAYFPFADSIELAYKSGINAVIQPGGSVRDNESIDFCNDHGISMVFTGTRHFKH